MLGTYTTKEAQMQQHLEKVRDLIRQFQTWKVTQIPRDENVEADALANLSSAADVASNENASVIHLFHSVLDPDKNETCRVATSGHCTVAIYEMGDGYRGSTITSKMTVEIGEPSTRFTQTSEESNNEEMRINIDLLKGKREAALIRMAAQKQVIERYYNRNTRLRFFKIRDFVLKKGFQSMKAANAGKLSPAWEGPYMIHDIAGKRAYELDTMDGKILLSHWNVVHLKRYYF
ncbi:uncharacterized protein [Nicotiana sylvestris]|uniref:uncharacterized protein n=1 Tax=Nicotiana sylvestris TaxID=4096 RepID=UPI00388C5BEC